MSFFFALLVLVKVASYALFRATPDSDANRRDF
jgi:hypothetical protein